MLPHGVVIQLLPVRLFVERHRVKSSPQPVTNSLKPRCAPHRRRGGIGWQGHHREYGVSRPLDELDAGLKVGRWVPNRRVGCSYPSPVADRCVHRPIAPHHLSAWECQDERGQGLQAMEGWSATAGRSGWRWPVAFCRTTMSTARFRPIKQLLTIAPESTWRGNK